MASTIPPEENRVCLSTVRKAVKALLKWRKLHPKTAKKSPSQLFLDNESDDNGENEEENREFLDNESDDNGDLIYLVLTLKKIPPKELSKTPHKIPLPNPLHSFSNNNNNCNLNLCLIIDDRPIKSPNKITAEVALKKISSEDIPITAVLKLSKLKLECKSLEGRRKLYHSFDMFFADKRVVSLLPNVLGKQFYKQKRKVPVALDLRGLIGWKEEIERACDSSFLCLGSGTCSVIRVGRCGLENEMGSDVIVENVFAAIRGLVEVVPKKWGGIRALHLKLSDSLALPIYDALPELRVNVEGGVKVGGLKGRKNEVLEGGRSSNVNEL